MPTFDYITVKEFRESLETDHTEMRKSVDVQAWKSVQVMAGSIVESLLIDHLLSTTNPVRPNKDPLKLDLSEAITICQNEGVLSDRTADLCSVIRSYRNLIHPGRLIRLNEQPPTRNSATIAFALVDMISDEIAKNKRATVGLTAEQILSKVMRDTNSLTILKHLLQEVNEQQRERLLISLIPEAFEANNVASDGLFGDSVHPEHLMSAYRTVLDSVSDEVKRRVASEFVRILREGDGDYVIRYEKAFFRPSDLEYVPTHHRAMVREHLLGQVPAHHTPYTLNLTQGIGKYLAPTDVQKWLDPFIRTFFATNVNAVIKQNARSNLLWEVITTSSEVEAEIQDRLTTWISFYEEKELHERVKYLNDIQKEIDEQIPF